ncbi:uncharacterized protein [Leuresthes tenuis]|uniref:uncharacterized protein n=1 Tax=Leuresthes tenuis TaxID=355514 RepID=UPI003B5137BE
MSTAMDGVLEGAVVLCACKLVCSLLFLPSLVASHSPVSFCCCCLLIFTDFLVAVFLSLLWLIECWLTELNPPGDVIALRFLLFLSHTYAAVFLLTTFLTGVETLIRLLWPHAVADHRKSSRVVGSDGQSCYVGEVNVEEDEDVSGSDNGTSWPQVVGFLCCLSVWVFVALIVRWHLKMEEVWTVVCLHTSDSLVRCLPNLFTPVPSAMTPWWVMVFLFFLLLLLTISTCLQRQHQAPVQTERIHEGKHGNCCWKDFVPVLSAPSKPMHTGMSVSDPPQCVDPEKTDCTCTGNRAYSWNGVQMSAHHHGDIVFISRDCLSEKRGGQERKSTKTGIPLTFITEEHTDLQRRNWCGWQWWGFPSLEGKVMTGLLGVLPIFMLPFNLSVNILLIRTIDTLLECCIKSLLSAAADTRDTSTSQSVTKV